MMKKTLKTTIATIASMALIGATTVLSAGAVSIDIEDVTLPTVPTNRVVPVNVYVKDSTGFNLMSLVIDHDSKLVPSRIAARDFGAPVDVAAGTIDATQSKIALSAASAEIFRDTNFTLLTINFTIPEGAKAGDRYPITFQDFSSLPKFSFGSSEIPVAASALVASGGFIEIAPEVTTVTTTTTTEPTTTTTVTTTDGGIDTGTVTTPASGSSATDVTTAITTAGSTTTSRATTTTARATTTTKSSATNSPKTGDATKGVIPAMAAMAAAAVAAFVVRKKK